MFTREHRDQFSYTSVWSFACSSTTTQWLLLQSTTTSWLVWPEFYRLHNPARIIERLIEERRLSLFQASPGLSRRGLRVKQMAHLTFLAVGTIQILIRVIYELLRAQCTLARGVITAQWLAYLLPDQAALGSIPSIISLINYQYWQFTLFAKILKIILAADTFLA